MIYIVDLLGKPGVASMGVSLLTHALRGAGHGVTQLDFADEEEGGSQGSLFAESRVTKSWVGSVGGVFASAITPRSLMSWPSAAAALGVRPLAKDRSSGPPVIFGGQMCSAPGPLLGLADVVCLGDGEVTGPIVAAMIEAGATRAEIMRDLDGMDGFSVWPHEPLSLRRVESDAIGTTVIAPNGRGATTIEMARGCKSRCLFCPIGWAGGGYREAPREGVEAAIRANRGKPLNLYAPDYSAVTWVEEADAALERASCSPKGRDARPDVTLRRLTRGAEPTSAKSYSFGVEGMSERIRGAIGKTLPHADLVSLMGELSARGNRNVKWYLIAGFPGESDSDLDELFRAIADTSSVYQGHMSITMTMLQPSPHTPFERLGGHYNQAAADRAHSLRAHLRERFESGGGRIIASEPKGPSLHEHDVVTSRLSRVSDAEYWVNARKSRIASGRWRDDMDRIGIDPDALLAPIAASARPWAGVDVGTPAQSLERAWSVYERRMLTGVAERAA